MNLLKSLSYEDYVNDLKAMRGKTVILRAITPKGHINIEAFKSVIVASDHEGKEIARSYTLDESGLKWIKAKCRGWHGWDFKLKWNITTK